MKKTIKLYGNNGSYIEGNEQIRLDEDFEFEIANISDENFFYIANNGIENRKELIVDNKFILPRHFIKVGELSIKVEQIHDNRVAKTFIVDKLIIKEADDVIYSIPEVESLKNKIAQYSKLVDDLGVQVMTLTKLVAGLYNTEIK